MERPALQGEEREQALHVQWQAHRLAADLQIESA